MSWSRVTGRKILLTQAACPVLPNLGQERLLFHLIHLEGFDFDFFFFLNEVVKSDGH